MQMSRVGAVTWLDFRADDLARARDLIRSLQDEGVLDELGFLVLFGCFADIFYPATSTVMRGARYLYFVAGTYQQLEREDGVRSSNVTQLARKRQDALRDALAATQKTGVIGRDAKIGVKQLPSAVYWSCLRRLGMFNGGLSEAAYLDAFDRLRVERRGFADDDKSRQASGRTAYWDADLPAVRFLNESGAPKVGINFKLTRAEAADLARRYETRYEHSLLTHQLRHGIPNSLAPWNAHRPTEYLAAHLDRAENVSLFARGVTLHYYHLLGDARDKAGLSPIKDTVTPVFERWWEEARPKLRNWNAAELASVQELSSSLRHGSNGDIAFMNGWLARVAVKSSARALVGDSTARELVRAREVAIKPAKARLKSRKHLEQWRSSTVKDTVYQFDYRHSIGTRFVSDMLEGLEKR
jgi:Family of unknown function (DUF6361)